MKSPLITASFLVTALLVAAPAFAQDSSAHAAAASADTSAAAGQSTAAVAASAATGIRVASGVAAVPLWMIGSVSTGSAAASTQAAGSNVRPKLNNQVGAPPKHDPSPAEVMKNASK